MVPSPVTRNMNDQKLDGIILMPQLFQGIDDLADIESSKYSAEKKKLKEKSSSCQYFGKKKIKESGKQNVQNG